MNYLPNENFICPAEGDLELQTEDTKCVTHIRWVMAQWLLGVFFLLFVLLHPCFFPPTLSMQCRSQGLPTTQVSFGIAHNGFGFGRWKAGDANTSRCGGEMRKLVCVGPNER